MKKTNKIVLFSLAGIIVLAFILKIFGAFGENKGIKVAVEKAQKRNITELITANGRIKPQTEVKISSDVSGEIVELYVREGDEVKKGQLLLKIKPDIYLSNLDRVAAGVNSSKANLAQAKARLAQAKARLEQAKAAFNRSKELYRQKALSKADYEQAESTYLSAEAELEAGKQTVRASEFSVKSSEASLKEARENLNKTSIYAPMDGTVSMLNVEKGERVVGTIQMNGTELLRIADMSKMEVLVNVNENDIVKVKRNDTVLIEIDAYFEKEFHGLVTEIANSSNNTGQVIGSDNITDFEVKILILKESYQDLIPEDNPNFYPFRPGMSATADIKTGTEYNVLTVPIQAVTTRTDTTNIRMKFKAKKDSNFVEYEENKEPIELVFVYKDGYAKAVSVKTGIQDNKYIMISEGLNENDEVITAPYNTVAKLLKNGQKVQKTDKSDLFKSENN